MKTQTIAGHEITLEEGKRYRASRPIGVFAKITVTIRDMETSARRARVTGLSYDEANDLLDAFNNGTTSFDGRVW